MGMYTELILGASFKEDTPKYVIDCIKYLIGEISEKPSGFPLVDGRFDSLLTCSSFYFGISEPINKFWFCEISGSYKISSRCNLKNYKNEIETFLNWLKPFLDSGSGSREMYAIVTYEEDEEPTIFYLED